MQSAGGNRCMYKWDNRDICTASIWKMCDGEMYCSPFWLNILWDFWYNNKTKHFRVLHRWGDHVLLDCIVRDCFAFYNLSHVPRADVLQLINSCHPYTITIVCFISINTRGCGQDLTNISIISLPNMMETMKRLRSCSFLKSGYLLMCEASGGQFQESLLWYLPEVHFLNCTWRWIWFQATN